MSWSHNELVENKNVCYSIVRIKSKNRFWEQRGTDETFVQSMVTCPSDLAYH